jgi:FKBP-type peptidyl-prolyl cis-trans isomerase
MRLPSGLEILEDREGDGEAAGKGDAVIYNVRIFLNRGDEVPINEKHAEYGLPSREELGRVLIDHRTVLGQRRVIAGVEKALYGMKPGGYRKVRVGPHLAYRGEGLPGLIPHDAVLDVQVWMRDVLRPSGPRG